MKIGEIQKREFLALLFLGLWCFSWGQEIPKISHFTKDSYNAQNQNWGIVQTDDCRMYFANSKGLLEFDGHHWQSYMMPNRQIVRSIAYGQDGRIYTGGYASFGYWAPDSLGQLQYVSLSHLLKPEETADEEIWNILVFPNRILFQSFTKIFIYQNEQLAVLLPPSKIMFLAKVGDQVVVPTIKKGLFLLQADRRFEAIKGSDIFYDKKIALILPYEKDSWLIGTQEGEIYAYRDGQFQLIENKLSKILKNYQLNKGIQLANGNYIFGTILQGLFETDARLRILRNINQETGLQNNTILSLYENHEGHLWVGMDKGIDLIELSGNLSFFNDVNGQLGTVYTAIQTDDYFYVGTNQGVFYKEKNKAAQPLSNSHFQLLEGSQGQVWQLTIINGQLFCGHNSGTFIIEGTQIRQISSLAGGWWLTPLPQQQEVLLQGTYTGLAFFTKVNGQWAFSHKAVDINFPLKKLLLDQTGALWAISPHKSLFSFQLSVDAKAVTSVKEWTVKDGLTTEFALDISMIQDKLIVKSGDDFLEYQTSTQGFVPIQQIGDIQLDVKSHKILDFGAAGYFKIFPHQLKWHQGQKQRSLNLALVPRYENIILLDSLHFLFCLDNGYAILERDKSNFATTDAAPAQAMISRVSIGEAYTIFPANLASSSPPALKPHQNQITFYGTAPCAFEHTQLEYLLEGTAESWADFPAPYSKEFYYLPPGDYMFKLREKNTQHTASFSFSMLPKWYQTNLFKVLYLLFALLLIYVLYKMHLRRLDRQRQKMEKEKEQQLAQQHIAMKNKQLQTEVILKSKELANSTMNLIKKNELLLTIKKNIKAIKTQSDKEVWRKDFQKLQLTIDKYLANEEDWEVFESNFNQVHETFLRKLKNKHSNLTPGDLKLAAYLKMNLSSKEIAPLLNISIRGVENKRYRLRQKLQISSTSNLTEYLMRY